MPNLKALCKSGVVFDNVWATPACSSTRAAILTGQYGLHNGVLAAGGGLNLSQSSIFSRRLCLCRMRMRSSASGMSAEQQTQITGNVWRKSLAGFLSSAEGFCRWEITDGVRSQVNGYATTVFTDKALEWVETPKFTVVIVVGI